MAKNLHSLKGEKTAACHVAAADMVTARVPSRLPAEAPVKN
ncbi:MAG: hypothetical protein ACYC35_07075 [Pirellulales bacterium]